jgi:hypothetical protein
VSSALLWWLVSAGCCDEESSKNKKGWREHGVRVRVPRAHRFKVDSTKLNSTTNSQTRKKYIIYFMRTSRRRLII